MAGLSGRAAGLVMTSTSPLGLGTSKYEISPFLVALHPKVFTLQVHFWQISRNNGNCHVTAIRGLQFDHAVTAVAFAAGLYQEG